MNRIPIIFLQAVIVLIGIGVFVFMLWEPHLESRNANATLYQIYFNDPFLAYVYTASIAFFIALYQAFKLLGHMGRDEAFSERSVKALRTIKYCAIAMIAFIFGAETYFFTVQRGREDDIAGGVAIGLFLMFVSVVIVAAAAVLEKLFRDQKMDQRLKKGT